ncbi:hypothetical protein KC734_23650, partial [candidate division KSB1 bacterium]|nr:hypothetical protein [candidate division KSB1 bacterium]
AALLKFFGSVDSVREASVDDLLLVENISQDLAQTIWEHFHGIKPKTDNA